MLARVATVRQVYGKIAVDRRHEVDIQVIADVEYFFAYVVAARVGTVGHHGTVQVYTVIDDFEYLTLEFDMIFRLPVAVVLGHFLVDGLKPLAVGLILREAVKSSVGLVADLCSLSATLNCVMVKEFRPE